MTLSFFISFEGGDGSGKSLQSKKLYNSLINAGFSVVLTYEPGGTELGNEIRKLLKKESDDLLSAEVELFLFNACRAHLVNKVILPALENEKIVICDRFADSTVVYQGYGRGIDLKIIEMMQKVAIGGLKPDITILLDIPAEIGLTRKSYQKDRFEDEGLDFQRRIRDGYLQLAACQPDRWLVIDALSPVDTIAENIWKHIKPIIAMK